MGMTVQPNQGCVACDTHQKKKVLTNYFKMKAKIYISSINYLIKQNKDPYFRLYVPLYFYYSGAIVKLVTYNFLKK